MPPAPPPESTSRLKTAGLVALLLVTALTVNRLVAARYGFAYPGGSDPGIWVFAAMNRSVGATVRVSPLYPALIWAFHLGSASVIQVAAKVSMVAWSLVPPVTLLLARSLGATRPTALLAGLATLLVPTLLVTGFQSQPDALNVLVCLVATLAAARFLERPNLAWTAVLVATGAVAPLVREHGLAVDAAVALVLVAAPGHPAIRVARLLALAGATWAAPWITGQAPCLPWDAPWLERLRFSVGTRAPGLLRTVLVGRPQAEQDAVVAAFEAGDRLTIQRFYVWNALHAAPWHWAWLGTAVALAPLLSGRRRWAIAVGVLPVLPALLIFSMDRHTLLVVPVGMAVLAAAAGGRRWRGLACAALAVAWIVGGWSALTPNIRRLQGENAAMARMARFGEALCADIEPGAVATGADVSQLVFCPLPFLPPPATNPPPSVYWKAWAFGGPVPGAGWSQVTLPEAPLVVYRFHPELAGGGRPCWNSLPVGRIPYDRPEPVQITLDPPCTSEALAALGGQ